ncbi:MAG: hypothetical protein ACXWLR_09550 [Myxococcales bacterium]
MDPYLTNAEALLRQGKARLESLSVTMRAAAPAFSLLVRRRKLMNFEARYADVSRRLELLRGAGTEGVANLKVGLEKSLETFRSEIGWREPMTSAGATVEKLDS